MTDRRLPADRPDRQPGWWFWLLIFVVLLAAWYWFEWPAGEAAPAPPVEIGSPAGRAADADRIERPPREPRQLDRTGSGPEGDTAPAAAPGEPPVPLSPRS